jgi:hypothetical protein
MQGKLILTEVDRDLLDELLGMRVVQAVEADRYWQARFTVTCNWVDLPYIHRILARVGEREPAAQPAQPVSEEQPHKYLSTGCFHENHAYCQSNTGANGAKVPATCKFCAAPCICICHCHGADGPER